MEVQFEFNKQLVPLNLINLDNIGDFALECFNDNFSTNFYILVITKNGFSTIFNWGPVIPDLGVLEGYFFTMETMEYKEKKLCKKIETLLNSNGITQAKKISKEEALEYCQNEKDIILWEIKK